jgi:hypothetical protein
MNLRTNAIRVVSKGWPRRHFSLLDDTKSVQLLVAAVATGSTSRSAFASHNPAIRSLHRSGCCRQRPTLSHHDGNNRLKPPELQATTTPVDQSPAAESRPASWIQRVANYLSASTTRRPPPQSNPPRDAPNLLGNDQSQTSTTSTSTTRPNSSSSSIDAKTTISGTLGTGLWHRAAPYLEHAGHSLGQAARSVGAAVTRNVQSTVSSVGDSLQEASRRYWSTRRAWIQRRVQMAWHHASQRMQSLGTSVGEAVTRPVRTAATQIAQQWQQGRVWNRFWWWSLAAIAVYGVATTLPKEMVRLVLAPAKRASPDASSANDNVSSLKAPPED